MRFYYFKKYWKEFFRLWKEGYSPVKMIILSLKENYWRAVISSGNGDLYFYGGYCDNKF